MCNNNEIFTDNDFIVQHLLTRYEGGNVVFSQWYPKVLLYYYMIPPLEQYVKKFVSL